MADPRFNVVPYRDPYDIPLSPSFFNLTNPTLSDLSNNNFNTNNNNILAALSAPQQIQLFGHGNGNGNGNGVQEFNHNLSFPNPMMNQDQFVHMGNYFPNIGGLGSSGGFNFEVGGPSQVHGEPIQPPIGNFFGSQNYNNNNNNNDMLALTSWQDLQTPFSCTCCQVIREIIHTNGITFTKLEIHGKVGMICHAIQHHNINGLNRGSSSNQFQMIDFTMSNIHEIKNFLVQYCLGQNSLGYIMMQDPLSPYYEALCTGLDWAEDLSDLVEGQSGDDMEQEEAETAKIPRATLAEQRERAAKMTLHDLSDYFHLTIDECSKHVNLCPTVVKKVCRKGDLKRWPYRKIKSIVKQITVLRKNLNSADGVAKTRTEAQIRRLEEDIIRHCGGVAPTKLTY